MPSPRLVRPLVLAVLLAVYLTQIASFWPYVNDDAYITFRYSRNLATGNGPYFNPGEHVEGYSNLLWMLLLTPIAAGGGENALPRAAKILGATSGAICILLLGLWPRAGRAGILAAGLLAVSPAFALNGTSGLETLFYGLGITLGVFLSQWGERSGRWRGAGLAFASAALTRPEGAAVFAIFLAAELVTLWGDSGRSLRDLARSPGFRRRLLPDAVVVGAVIAAQLVWRMAAYDGEFLPNTYYAKVGGFAAIQGGAYIREGLKWPFLGLIGLILGLVGWILTRKRGAANVALFTVAVGGMLLPTITGSDWMLGSRLLVPYLPLLGLVVATGWLDLAARLGAFRPLRWAPTALFVLIPLAWPFQAALRHDLVGYTRERAEGYRTGHRALAAWLHQEAKPGETVALMDIGLVGFSCMELRILDVSGLTDRFIAKSPGGFLAKQYEPGYVFGKKPEFVVLVYTGLGDPEQPLPVDAPIGEWTVVEAALAKAPEFERHYRHRRPLTHESWTQDLAESLGAERVFPHRHPGSHYLLAVFRRRE